jgi:two-component system OmpR family sensor kinase
MALDINGWKMKSLLNKNLMQFILCMLIILILVTPLFYLLTKNFYSEEMMEAISRINSGKHLGHSDFQQDIVEGMVIQFMLIFGVMSISLMLVMRFLTRRLWRPFNDTLRKIELFNLEQSDIPQFIPSGITEFERLNSSVYRLMKKDKDSYKSQKEFTENASHELQTPIAVIQSKLDLLMQENLNENQSLIVADMYNVFRRLSRLNKSLLLLAKIDNSQYKSTEKVDLLAFLKRRLPLYSVFCGSGEIVLDESSEELSVNANITLLESMLDNLVVNAVRNSKEGTDIIVTLKNHSLSVENQGNGNMALDSAQLFKRFSKNESRSDGHGLGLSIVKAICDYHQWTIKYHFINGRHQFVVTFKS